MIHVYLTSFPPFPATSEEVCQRFATSPERLIILDGWLRFRQELTRLGVTTGFQWLDGSFLEDVEKSASRAPNDLDIVTFYRPPVGVYPADLLGQLQTGLPAFFLRTEAKKLFKLDHFGVHLGSRSEALVDSTRYWTGLFSHNRAGVWKGMLRIELNTPVEDTAAAALLKPPAP